MEGLTHYFNDLFLQLAVFVNPFNESLNVSLDIIDTGINYSFHLKQITFLSIFFFFYFRDFLRWRDLYWSPLPRNWCLLKSLDLKCYIFCFIIECESSDRYLIIRL
jgi:hypothetical protein